jgi:hypothetical protein
VRRLAADVQQLPNLTHEFEIAPKRKTKIKENRGIHPAAAD